MGFFGPYLSQLAREQLARVLCRHVSVLSAKLDVSYHHLYSQVSRESKTVNHECPVERIDAPDYQDEDVNVGHRTALCRNT